MRKAHRRHVLLAIAACVGLGAAATCGAVGIAGAPWFAHRREVPATSAASSAEQQVVPSAEKGPKPSPNPSLEAQPAVSASPGCPDFGRALARGRQAAARYDLASAIAAFDEAVRTRPLDGEARSERANVYLLQGDAKRALWDLARAEAHPGNERVLRQIWYNIGVAFDKLGQTERARLAWAVALSHGSTVAEQRLGDHSRCTALIDAQSHPKGPIVSGFLELAKFREPHCDLPSPPADSTSEERTRRRICLTCDGEDACGDADITRVESATNSLEYFPPFLFAALGGRGYWYTHSWNSYTVRTAAGYAVVSTNDGTPEELFGTEAGSISHVEGGFQTGDGIEVVASGHWSDEESYESEAADASPRCEPLVRCTDPTCGGNESPRPMEIMAPRRHRPHTVLYSLATRRQVLSVSEQAGEINLEVKPGTVVLTGSGCDETISIAK
jgi:hypothetical protein